MSTTVRGFGFIAVLAKPIANADEREELQNKLWEDSGLLDVNYEGTLVIFDYNKRATDRDMLDHFTIGNSGLGDPHEIVKACEPYGLKIVEEAVLPFSAIWYTGADAPHNELTLEEFNKHLVK